MRIFTLVQWTFGFLATSARTKDEMRLKILTSYAYVCINLFLTCDDKWKIFGLLSGSHFPCTTTSYDKI